MTIRSAPERKLLNVLAVLEDVLPVLIISLYSAVEIISNNLLISS